MLQATGFSSILLDKLKRLMFRPWKCQHFSLYKRMTSRKIEIEEKGKKEMKTKTE